MALFDNIRRQRELKQRGMNTPQPRYNNGAYQDFRGAAAQGGDAAAFGRGGMQDAMGMYKDMAMGNGPSVAEQQMRRGGDQAIANANAIAAQGRSGNLGAAQQQAGSAGAAIGMQTNADAAQLRAAEQQQAMAGYAGVAGQYAQGGLAQQGMGLGLQGQAAGQQLASDTQWGLGQRAMDLEQLQGNRGFGLGVAQGLTGAAGTGAGIGAMFSDMRAKEDVMASGGAATEAARAANPINFEYREGMGPPGQRTGISANALATTPAGAAVTTPDPNTGMLTVDPAQLSGLSMAAAAETVNRVDRIERMLDRLVPPRASSQPVGVGREGFPPMSEHPTAPKKKKKKREGLSETPKESRPTRPLRPGSSRRGPKDEAA